MSRSAHARRIPGGCRALYACGVRMDLRRLRPERPPVLLLGGLGLARALGMAGIPAIVASADARSPVLASRFAAARLALPPAANRAALLETLARAGERIMAALGVRAPLFCGADEWLGPLEELRGELQTRFSLLPNEPGLAAALLDKARFEPFARSRGLPVPRMLRWEELADFSRAVIARPRAKTHAGAAASARVFASGACARRDLGARRDAVLFQEYVEGASWSFHGYSGRDGKPLAWFVGRAIRAFPSLTGTASFLELARHDELAALGCALAARLRLKGAYAMDFRRDAGAARWRLLGIDPRFHPWHYLGARNGINLPEVAYEHLVYGARPAAATRHACRYRWLDLRLDYRAFREARARGQLSAARWLWSLARAPKLYELFAWSDPLPFLQRVLASRRGAS